MVYGKAAYETHFVSTQPVQRSLEVVKNYRVIETFADEAEFPKRVDANSGRRNQNLHNRENIEHEKDNAKDHCTEHDCKTRGYPDYLGDCEFITALDVVEKSNCCEDPPRVTKSVNAEHLVGGREHHRQKASHGLVRRNRWLVLL